MNARDIIDWVLLVIAAAVTLPLVVVSIGATILMIRSFFKDGWQ